eukprot:TRINITY_DN37505_c1_g1_i1.p1 TRINITY_DN37505_c1_g1~~TRINITY_DN37505_c1_g1_i1.p1  ORF type:complete len:570 (+),score=131.17 TRINITY_DN37505_c1_g1_i1:73-1710(+)
MASWLRRALLVVVPAVGALCVVQLAQTLHTVHTDSPLHRSGAGSSGGGTRGPAKRAADAEAAPPRLSSRQTPRPPPPGGGPADGAGGGGGGGSALPEVEWDRAADGVGPLGRIGKRAALREKLRSNLCSKCRPVGSTRPEFCSEDSATVPSPVYDFTARPQPARAAALPRATPAIFVALGDRLHAPPGQVTGRQDYVEEALRQWRLFNPPEESKVFLIVSDVYRGTGNVTWQWARKYHITLVFDSEVSTTPEWARYQEVFYVQGYMHPGGTRKTGNMHFNKLVMQRFHAVHALMQREGLTHAVHMENDIMVYSRWRDHLEAVVNCGPALASTFASPKGVIPSVVYIRDAEAVGDLVRFVNDLLSCSELCSRPHLTTPAKCAAADADACTWSKKGAVSYAGQCFGKFGTDLNKLLGIGLYANDMTYLLNYWQYKGSAALAPLPAWEHKPKENCVWEQRPREIFDLASLGQWYSFSPPGQDPPRPAKQYVLAQKQGRFLDATPPPYIEWRTDQRSRRVPYWKGLKILSLHIHGKNLWRFRSIDPEEK